jgi:4-amino-4-deoxy-L-arabinose transferase-like glycosyltransferase
MASAGESSSFSSLRLSVSTFAQDRGLGLSLAAIGLLLIFRIALAATSNLAEDEAYYWLWSTHLAAGYYDHPPMVAYWIRAGTSLFGQSAFGVRFAGLIGTVAGSYLLYLTSLSLFRNRLAAFTAVLWLNTTLLFNAAAIVATPDTPLAFFTTLTLFALARLMETGRSKWWFAVGAALGFAFMSKYTAVLLLPGVFLWMLASPEGRRWLGRPEPYIGALIALLLVAPVFYWNYVHDWVSFAKQAGHGVKDKPASAILSMAELLGGQTGLVTPLIFAFCLFGSFYALLRGWRRRDPRWLLLGTMSAPLFAFFYIYAAEQKIQANWPGLVYPAAILAAVRGVFALAKERELPRWIGASFRLAPWVGIAFTLVAFLQLGFDALPIEAKKDPTSRLKGWAKLGAGIEALERSQGAIGTLTDRYAITGELAFYRSLQHPVLQIGERIRYANLPAPDEAKLKQGLMLLVVRKGGDPSLAAAFFETSRFLQTLVRDGGLHPRDAYDVYLMAGYRGGLFGQGAVSGKPAGGAP